MKKRDDRVYLHDMLDAIRIIETYLQGLTYETFGQDKLRQDGVVRELEIIGEASRNLSEAFQLQHAEIPWADIIGMRHKIVHDYSNVNLRIVWDTVANDLPPLKQQLKQILGDSNES